MADTLEWMRQNPGVALTFWIALVIGLSIIVGSFKGE